MIYVCKWFTYISWGYEISKIFVCFLQSLDSISGGPTLDVMSLSAEQHICRSVEIGVQISVWFVFHDTVLSTRQYKMTSLFQHDPKRFEY